MKTTTNIIILFEHKSGVINGNVINFFINFQTLNNVASSKNIKYFSENVIIKFVFIMNAVIDNSDSQLKCWYTLELLR